MSPSTSELQHLIERLGKQPEDFQRYLADFMNEVLDEQEQDEVEATPDELEAIRLAQAEIAAGDYVTLDELRRELRGE